MASNANLFIILALINFMCISLALVISFDIPSLQDICVADPIGNALCKDPKTVSAIDFFLGSLDQPGAFNSYGVAIKIASPDTAPGFNTQGMSFSLVKFAENGYLPPHTHPSAAEVIYVVVGAC